MPSEDAELVVGQFQAVNDRDFGEAMGRYAEDVELFVHPDAFLESGTYSGREAVGRWFGDWFRTFERGYRFEIDEARNLGDGVVLLIATHSGRGRSSGVAVRKQTGYVYTVRDGLIARAELYPSPAAAAEAAESR